MKTSAILKCGCPDNGPAAQFQSKKYGPGMRVHTVGQKNPKDPNKQARCTCCGAKQYVNEYKCH